MTKQVKILINLAKTLREDAEMALSGDWDKSDNGFQIQINHINEVLDNVKRLQEKIDKKLKK